MTPITFLVVEDDDVDMMSIERALKEIGIVNPIKRAVDGQEAWDIVTEASQDKSTEHEFIILLDLNMPRMNGLEFLDKYFANPDFPKTSIFVLTTSDADGDIIGAHEHGISGYLLKSDLVDSVREAITGLERKWMLIA